MGNAAHYIGRVGALAVALGVGIALANTPVVASAGTADSSASSSSGASSSSSSRHSGATSTHTSATLSSTSNNPGRLRGPLNGPGQGLSSSGGLTSSPAASTPAGPAPAGEVGRTRSGAPGVIVGTGGPHTSSSTISSESAVTTSAHTQPTSTSSTAPASTPATPEAPSSDIWHTVGTDSSPRSGSTAVIGRRQPETTAPAVRSPWTKATQPAAATTAPSVDTTAPVSSLDATRVVADVARPSALTKPPDLSTATAPAPAEMSFTAEVATTAEDPPAPAVTNPTPPQVLSGIVSTLVGGVLSPFADNAPTTPVQTPMLWTLLAFVRREFEQTFSIPSPPVDPLAAQPTTELLTGAPVLSSQSINPAIAGNVGAPSQALTDLKVNGLLENTKAPAIFTGEPSIVSQVFTVFYRVLGAVADFLGVDLATPLGHLLSSNSPPWFTTLGLNVQRSEVEGMPVWILQSPGSPSEKTVVAVPGSAFVWPPTLFHWLNYAAMARNTGAAVAVPIYSVVPQGGTAATVVPAMADLISWQIDQHGAENVSVYGDSLGGSIGLTAVQELVRRGDPVPSHMVLISPALDLTFSNPAIRFVDDPVFSGLFFSNVRKNAELWAGDLGLTDPLVSPLFGSLAGLPPTALYFGSLEILAPDGLVLQDKALATPGADFTFILRNGELHIWAVNTILPETIAVLPDIYQQLGLAT